MKLEIRKIHLQNFKGCKDKTVEFDGNSKIVGENGSGKSTIASAISWVMADADYNLIKNPNVIPMGMPECEIKVEIEFSIDEKPLEVSKTQKNKAKEVDGKITSSSTNTYAINSVNKSRRDFEADLVSRGIDIENFLIYTNPNSFLADTSKSGREKIRKILFEMASNVTDEEIAKEIGADDVVRYMSDKGYNLDEIKSSAKSTISKIVAENGKSNELINSKIDGMLSSKSTADAKVLAEQKSNYESEIERIETKLAELSCSKTDISKKLSELKIERDKVAADANADLYAQKVEIDKKYREIERSIDEYKFQLSQAEREKSHIESELAELNENIKKQRTLYKIEQDARLDEGDLVCPSCKRVFEKDKLAEKKAEFEKHKTEKLKTIKASGESIKASIAENEGKISEVNSKIDNYKKLVSEAEKQFESVKKEISKIPASVDLSKDKKYKKLSEQIEKLESELATDDDALIEELTSQKNVNKQMLNQVVGELGTLEQNKVIDNNVAALRAKRQNDEIIKANAEKILDEVDRVEMAKNSKLAESINAHFDLVEWHLWDRQKNGTLIEVTEPYIDGKPMTSCANGSLMTLAKLSICEALQKVRNQRMPIWCDDASLFSKNTTDRIKLDTQFIQLIVADGVKEIRVERG